jgi:hypothetical protein
VHHHEGFSLCSYQGSWFAQNTKIDLQKKGTDKDLVVVLINKLIHLIRDILVE